MIKINPSKTKKLSFNISVQGMKPELLEYHVRLYNDKNDYGFKGKISGDQIVFEIPPLNEILNENIIESLSNIKLEAHDIGNKYYLKPFEDKIKIENDLKVEVKIAEEEIIKEDSNLNINVSIFEEKEETPKIETPKKQTNFNRFLKS